MPWMGTVSFTDQSYYNATELTRENTNIQYIRDQLAANGYSVVLPHPTAGVVRTDFPTVSRINQTKSNILALIAGFYKPINVPDVAVNNARKQKFDWVEANKLELNIQGLYDTLNKMIDSYRYCGTFNAGEEGLL